MQRGTRRELLKFGGAGIATLATTKLLEAGESTDNIDFILSVSCVRGEQHEDLGGIQLEQYPIDQLREINCCAAAASSTAFAGQVSITWQMPTPEQDNTRQLQLSADLVDGAALRLKTLTVTEAEGDPLTVELNELVPFTTAAHFISIERAQSRRVRRL